MDPTNMTSMAGRCTVSACLEAFRGLFEGLFGGSVAEIKV